MPSMDVSVLEKFGMRSDILSDREIFIQFAAESSSGKFILSGGNKETKGSLPKCLA